MQQNKGINNIYIIGDSQEKNANDIFHTLSIMKIARIGQFFNSVKRCGVDVSDIILLLLNAILSFKKCPNVGKIWLGGKPWSGMQK